jgi:hypothetical protein
MEFRGEADRQVVVEVEAAVEVKLEGQRGQTARADFADRMGGGRRRQGGQRRRGEGLVVIPPRQQQRDRAERAIGVKGGKRLVHDGPLAAKCDSHAAAVP